MVLKSRTMDNGEPQSVRYRDGHITTWQRRDKTWVARIDRDNTFGDQIFEIEWDVLRVGNMTYDRLVAYEAARDWFDRHPNAENIIND